MASVLEIYNRALQKLGAKRITSVDENSTAAQECNACYSILRDSELMGNRWAFAIKRASLAADTPTPTWGRDNSFTLPSDCLLVIPPYVEDDNVYRDWVIENKKIISDEAAPLYIRYIGRIEDPTEMDVLFREALSTKMAYEMCEKITQSNSKKESLRADYDEIIKRARKQNAIQSVPAKSPDDTWIMVRY